MQGELNLYTGKLRDKDHYRQLEIIREERDDRERHIQTLVSASEAEPRRTAD